MHRKSFVMEHGSEASTQVEVLWLRVSAQVAESCQLFRTHTHFFNLHHIGYDQVLPSGLLQLAAMTTSWSPAPRWHQTGRELQLAAVILRWHLETRLQQQMKRVCLDMSVFGQRRKVSEPTVPLADAAAEAKTMKDVHSHRKLKQLFFLFWEG